MEMVKRYIEILEKTLYDLLGNSNDIRDFYLLNNIQHLLSNAYELLLDEYLDEVQASLKEVKK